MDKLISFKPYMDKDSDHTIVHGELYSEFNRLKSHMNYSMYYNDLCKFVVDNISNLLTSAVARNPDALYIITDTDFLAAFNSIANSITLNKDQINRFNRVYRAYVINPSNNVIYNEYSANLLYEIALKLNKEKLNRLTSVGLEERLSVWIVVNRYSSTDERRNIRRTVRAMQHMSYLIMTEKMITDIFSIMFADQFTNLFVAIMTDRFDEFDSEEEKYIYSTVSNTLLNILNTMDGDDIKDIVSEYESELKESGVSGRFSLKSINSGDYKNICIAIQELESMGLRVE